MPFEYVLPPLWSSQTLELSRFVVVVTTCAIQFRVTTSVSIRVSASILPCGNILFVDRCRIPELAVGCDACRISTEVILLFGEFDAASPGTCANVCQEMERESIERVAYNC